MSSDTDPSRPHAERTLADILEKLEARNVSRADPIHTPQRPVFADRGDLRDDLARDAMRELLVGCTAEDLIQDPDGAQFALVADASYLMAEAMLSRRLRAAGAPSQAVPDATTQEVADGDWPG